MALKKCLLLVKYQKNVVSYSINKTSVTLDEGSTGKQQIARLKLSFFS